MKTGNKRDANYANCFQVGSHAKSFNRESAKLSFFLDPFTDPFTVPRGAADEFVSTVEVPHEEGGTELRDGGGWKIEGVKRDSVRSFNFHAASMTEGVIPAARSRGTFLAG